MVWVPLGRNRVPLKASLCLLASRNLLTTVFMELPNVLEGDIGTHEVKPQMSLHSSHRTADGTGCFLKETDPWLGVALKMLPH